MKKCIKDSLEYTLNKCTDQEVQYVMNKLALGQMNFKVYDSSPGECGCLIGTILQARGQEAHQIIGWKKLLGIFPWPLFDMMPIRSLSAPGNETYQGYYLWKIGKGDHPGNNKHARELYNFLDDYLRKRQSSVLKRTLPVPPLLRLVDEKATAELQSVS